MYRWGKYVAVNGAALKLCLYGVACFRGVGHATSFRYLYESMPAALLEGIGGGSNTTVGVVAYFLSSSHEELNISLET